MPNVATTPIPVGAVVKYHGSMEEFHGLYTVREITDARYDYGVRLVLDSHEDSEVVLSNVRPVSVSMPLIGDYEARPSLATISEWRRKDYEAGRAAAHREHAALVSR